MTIEGQGAQARADQVRLGMVGGGQGAFIGAVHRIAARIDDRYAFIAGALSSDPARAKASGEELGLAGDRIYSDYTAMAQTEAARDDGIEAVSIVTPNHMHAPVATAFLNAGINVICDKPLCTTSGDGESLVKLAQDKGVIFAVTYNYSGYPMVRQARAMVEAGDLGTIRVVQAEYPQDWLTEKLEDSGQKQASWRTDPARSGAGGCVGDIGTHAYHLASYVTGLEAESVLADLTTFVEGRPLDDNVHVMLRYAGGAKGMLWASQVAPGNENGLKLRVYGTKGGLEWRQEEPNTLWFAPFGEPPRKITRAGAGAGDAAGRVTRIPAGHPEGYLEGFANVYREVADAIIARRTGNAPDSAVQFPTVSDGLSGVRFIEAAVKSSAAGGVWTPLKP